MGIWDIEDMLLVADKLFLSWFLCCPVLAFPFLFVACAKEQHRKEREGTMTDKLF